MISGNKLKLNIDKLVFCEVIRRLAQLNAH